MVLDPVEGNAPGGWTMTTIGGACDEHGGSVQTGPFGSQLHASDYVPVGIPSIMPKDLKEDRVSTDNIARISLADAERLVKYRVEPGDIVYSRRGDVERRALITDREDGWLCGTGCLRVRLGNPQIDPKFFFYYLGHPSVRAWIVRHAQGATMPNLNTSILRSVPLSYPPLEEQRRITSILGALDDKIKFNRKMNKTLEEMAQALFKSWFIDFDGHDDLVDSELGSIPRGWSAKPIGTVMGLAYGKSLPARRRILGDVPVYGSGGISGTHNEALVSGPGVIVGRKGSVGTIYWEERDFFPIDTTFYVESESSAWLAWAYYALAEIDIAQLGADSAVPGVNRNAVLAQPLPLPPGEVTDRFWEVVSPIRNRKSQLEVESRMLADLRDTLLPKLISGELRVPEAEKILELAV